MDRHEASEMHRRIAQDHKDRAALAENDAQRRDHEEAAWAHMAAMQSQRRAAEAKIDEDEADHVSERAQAESDRATDAEAHDIRAVIARQRGDEKGTQREEWMAARIRQADDPTAFHRAQTAHHLALYHDARADEDSDAGDHGHEEWHRQAASRQRRIAAELDPQIFG